MMNHARRSTPFLSRSAIAGLSVALILFLQLANATHHHEEPTLTPHDCAVCSQTQTLEHGAETDTNIGPSLAAAAGVIGFAHPPLLTRPRVSLPPARAPPVAV